MYGDGILYSGPSAYGSELASQPVDLQTDFANNSGGTITSANTFDTSGGNFDGIASKLSAFSLTVGTTYEIEIRGTTTSDGFTLGDLATTGNQYGSGFGVHRFVSLNTRLWIRQNNTTGTTTITHLSIRQVIQGSDFDFTRATTGTRINEHGYIEDVPYNLLTNSQNFASGYTYSDASYESGFLAPDGTATAFKITKTGSNGHVQQVITGPNTTMKKSIFAKTVSGTGTVNLLNHNSDTSALFTITNEWQRFEIDNAGLTQFFYLVDFRSLSGTLTEVLIWGAQLTKGLSKPYLPTTDRVNLPRLNYPVYGGCPSLLVEPQRTNSYTYSSDFTQTYWTKQNGATVSSNQTTSPEDIVNADKLISANLTNEQYLLNASISTTSGNNVTISCFVKKLDYDYFHIRFTATDGVWVAASVWYNIDNGTLGTVESGITAKIIEYPNGWYRCIATRTATGTGGGRVRLQLASSDNTANVVGDGTKGTFIYGAQWEVGSYATSLIHTSGSTVTRNQDQVQNAGVGTTDTFNSSEGVLYAEVENLAEDGNNKCISINDGGVNNRVTIVLGTATNQIRPHVLSGGTAVFDQNTFTVPTSTQFNKIAVKYKANDFSMFVDGIKVASDNSGAAPIGLNNLSLHVGSGGLRYFGDVKAVAVYKTALTDTELANLTSYNNHDLFIPYRSRMQMIGADQELQCTEHDITRFL